MGIPKNPWITETIKYNTKTAISNITPPKHDQNIIFLLPLNFLACFNISKIIPTGIPNIVQIAPITPRKLNVPEIIENSRVMNKVYKE